MKDDRRAKSHLRGIRPGLAELGAEWLDGYISRKPFYSYMSLAAALVLGAISAIAFIGLGSIYLPILAASMVVLTTLNAGPRRRRPGDFRKAVGLIDCGRRGMSVLRGVAVPPIRPLRRGR